LIKIPKSEWANIIARRSAGESLASIGRSYHCTAPAILYIVRKADDSRGEAPGGTGPRTSVARDHWASVYERHLAGETIAALAQDLGCSARTISRIVREQRWSESARTGAKMPGRRRGESVSDPAAQDRATGVTSDGSEGGGRPSAVFDRGTRRQRREAGARRRNGAAVTGGREAPPRAAENRAATVPGVIDERVRERITSDVAAFLSAFNAALEHDTPEIRNALLKASDRLLRAGANTRTEIERLEEREREVKAGRDAA
jgi:Mor family transcriptional regulator